MERPFCEVSDLRQAYGSTRVLDGVDLTINEGERVALMGPSGSGKSTLLNCLSGVDRPLSGSIRVGGLDVVEAAPAELAALRRDVVSTVFQFFHLLPTLSAAENIELGLQLAGVGTAERRERVRELLEAVELTHRENAFPETLSGGERQRVAIARALAHRPRLLLADEPTGSLDSRAGENILSLLRSLTEREGIAMLLVTHSETTASICPRIVRMRDGRVEPSA